MAINLKFTLRVTFLLYLLDLGRCELCGDWKSVLSQDQFRVLQKELQSVVHISSANSIYFSPCGRSEDAQTKAVFPAFCRNDSGICFTTKSGGQDSLLWDVPLNANPESSKQGTRVVMKAESTTKCKESKNNLGNYGVEIIFECPDDRTRRDPVLLSSSTLCLLRFLWTTEFACTSDLTSLTTEPSDENSGDIVGNDCKVTNPVLGYTYDLRKLSQVIEKQSDIGNFKVAVCKKPSFECGDGVGGCLKNGTENLSYGIYNDKLIYRNGTLLLTYKDGAVCDRDAKLNRTTLIQFICDHSSSEEVTLSHYDCHAHFHWKTKDACVPGRNITCRTADAKGNVYDLSSLTAFTHNHETENGNLTYLLNVCHTVVFGNEAECPSYAAGCLRNATGGQASYVSLGALNQPPSVDSDGILRLRYTDGDVCPEDINRSISTEIDFECSRESKVTAPKLVQYKDCTYHFSWKDESACPIETKKAESEITMVGEPSEIICHVESDKGHIDLSNLTRKFVSHAVTSEQMPGAKFLVNVCRPVNANEGCDGGAICLVTEDGKKRESLGKAFSTPVAVTGGADLLYTHGGVCKDDPSYNYTSRIQFRCDENAKSGGPSLEHYSHDCQYIFEWRTKYACPQTMKTIPKDCVLEDKVRDKKIDLATLLSLPDFQNSGICSGTAENSTYEILPDMAMLTYTTEKLCNSGGGHRVVEFHLKCDKEAEKPTAKRLKDQSCLLIVEVNTSQVCYLQDSTSGSGEGKEAQTSLETSSFGLVSAISWLIGILVTATVVLVAYKRRRTIAALWLRMRGFSRRSRDDGVRYSEVPSNQDHEVLFGAVDSRNLHDDSDDELIGV